MQLDDVTKQRLLLLCGYMESLPEEADKHFLMRSYISHQGRSGHRHSIPSHPQQADLLSCGTSACALGWATTMPEMQELGLYVRSEGSYQSVEGHEGAFPGLDGGSSDEAGHRWQILFEGFNKDETPKQWASRARKLIGEWSLPGAVTADPYDD